ncbi:type III pantothenate kinase [Emticicia sp. CRIBPO]|uniref:type III pantothenate kinase n=1 Tax=Emticicia sp. CRIBPO TaxID=2683258 RepID=UPI0014135E59|nr:type III pantothenate kinase [Emticicia sp. CRIBPO]NBA87950.1 type III pantothenate kinase [Emticicia sp. CRIBPO]
MNAAIDFGNTLAKIGFFEGDDLISTARGLRPEELFDLLEKENPERLIISSVTKSTDELKELFLKFHKKIILDPETPLPVVNGYGTPKTLGYDRIAGAVGAFARFPGQNCLIIDMGTAIKYDFIDAEGVFRGGIISPGKQMRFKALHTFTQKLPLIDSDEIPELLGTSTETCIQSGVINGIIAEINGIIARYNEKADINVLICGGDAKFFESQIKSTKFATPNLVLEGLNRILNHNVKSK